MNKKREYVSPQVTRVKLEPTQAVLSQCSVGITAPSQSDVTGFCSASKNCKQRMNAAQGDSAATS